LLGKELLEVDVDQGLLAGPLDLVEPVELEDKTMDELLEDLRTMVESSQEQIDELSDQVNDQMDHIESLQELIVKQQKFILMQQETIVQMDRGLKAVGSATVSGFIGRRRWYDKIKQHVLDD